MQLRKPMAEKACHLMVRLHRGRKWYHRWVAPGFYGLRKYHGKWRKYQKRLRTSLPPKYRRKGYLQSLFFRQWMGAGLRAVKDMETNVWGND